jgi:hypothetical protein
MRRLLMVGVLLLAGCQNVRGPLAPREPQRVDDPRFAVPEQQRRARERIAFPEESTNIGPRIGASVPTTYLR